MEKIKMAKFALVGMLNTGVDFAVFILLVYGFSFASFWAQILSFGCGIANSYVLNRKWTFEAKGRGDWREALRFVALNVTSFGAATVVLLGLQYGWDWPVVYAKAVSVFFSTGVNYAGSRYWVFRMENAGGRAQ